MRKMGVVLVAVMMVFSMTGQAAAEIDFNIGGITVHTFGKKSGSSTIIYASNVGSGGDFQEPPPMVNGKSPGWCKRNPIKCGLAIAVGLAFGASVIGNSGSSGSSPTDSASGD